MKMKKNTVKEFEYDGLGFPIVLLNVPLVEIRGVQVPDIDYNQFQKNVLHVLSHQLFPLTGNQIRFIRQFMEMTFSEFASKIGVTHACVINWEKAKNSSAKIQPSTEVCIRLLIMDALHVKANEFRDTFRNFNYEEFKSKKNQNSDHYITLDLSLTSNK